MNICNDCIRKCGVFREKELTEKGKYGFQMVAYDGEKNYSSSKSGKFVIKTDLVSASDSACLDLMAWQNDTLTDVYSAAIDSMPGEQEKKNPIFLQLA